nr:MAG TPA: hypothetical protein [Caudoviricetes sp.]
MSKNSHDILVIFLKHLPAPNARISTILHMGIDILFGVESNGKTIYTLDEIELLHRAFDDTIFDTIDNYVKEIDNSLLIHDKPRVIVFELLTEAARLIIDTWKGKNF